MGAPIELMPPAQLGLDPAVRNNKGWRAPTGRADKIRLDLNENRFISHERLQSLLDRVKPDQLTTYPEYDRAYRALSRYSGRPEAELLLSNGADQGIELVLRAFCPRRRLVLPVPTFSYYQHVAALLGIALTKVGYDSSFELDVEAVCRELRAGADGVVLVTPSNPLGTALDEASVLSIVVEASRLGAFVLIDEVYYEFHEHSFARLLDSFDNVVLVRSFSKGFGLAGLRLGYLASAPANIVQLDKLRGPWDVNALAAQLATTALERSDWLDFMPALLLERTRLRECLTEAGFDVAESCTNFLVARHPRARAIANWLSRHGLLVADLEDYADAGGILKQCLRIAVPNAGERDVVHGLLRQSTNHCHDGAPKS